MNFPPVERLGDVMFDEEKSVLGEAERNKPEAETGGGGGDGQFELER